MAVTEKKCCLVVTMNKYIHKVWTEVSLNNLLFVLFFISKGTLIFLYQTKYIGPKVDACGAPVLLNTR